MHTVWIDSVSRSRERIPFNNKLPVACKIEKLFEIGAPRKTKRFVNFPFQVFDKRSSESLTGRHYNFAPTPRSKLCKGNKYFGNIFSSLGNDPMLIFSGPASAPGAAARLCSRINRNHSGLPFYRFRINDNKTTRDGLWYRSTFSSVVPSFHLLLWSCWRSFDFSTNVFRKSLRRTCSPFNLIYWSVRKVRADWIIFNLLTNFQFSVSRFDFHSQSARTFRTIFTN